MNHDCMTTIFFKKLKVSQTGIMYERLIITLRHSNSLPSALLLYMVSIRSLSPAPPSSVPPVFPYRTNRSHPPSHESAQFRRRSGLDAAVRFSYHPYDSLLGQQLILSTSGGREGVLLVLNLILEIN